MSPPRIKVRGAARSKGVPAGYVLGRVSGGNGDVELLRIADLERLGVQNSRKPPSLLAPIPAQRVLGNAGPGDAAPSPLTISAVLDFISSTHGDILYRGASGWAALTAGTDGHVLTTHGASADPTWEPGGGAGGGSPVVWDDGSTPASNTIDNSAGALYIDSEYTFPAGSLVTNDVARLILRGVFGTAASAPTLRVEVFLGTTLIADTGAQTISGGITGQSWEAHVQIIVNNAGVSGVLEVQGSAQIDGYKGMPNTATLSLNTTIDQRLRVRFTWSAADPANTITTRQFVVEHMAGAFTPPPAGQARQFITANGFVNVTDGTLEYILPGGYLNEQGI